MKTCTRCKTEKPATKEFFRVNNRRKDGLNSACKECESKYREENKEHRAEMYKKWVENNRERKAETNKQWRKDNKEHMVEVNKRWYEENKEHSLELNKQWNDKNKEHNKEIHKQWCKGNPDRCKVINHRRRARKRDLEHTLTIEQWQETLSHFGNSCAYCGSTENITQEHFIPLSKSGVYTKNNIIPACGSCNSSKCNRDFEEWYPKQEFYDEEKSIYIIDFLNEMISILKEVD